MKEYGGILVCEDETIIASDIQRCLARFGYHVAGVASCGRQALEIAERTRPDLALMDIQLEGEMSGIDVADLMRSRYGIPVIFLTAHADSKTLERAKRIDPLGFIVKPFQDRELHSAVELGLYRFRRQCELQADVDDYKKRLGQAFSHSDIAGVSETREHFLEQEKMEAVRVLAGGVAHHLNNALAVVEANLGCLVEITPLQPQPKSLVTAAMQGSERAAWLVEQLLWFSGQRRSDLKEVIISDLVMEALDSASGLLLPGTEIVAVLPESPISIQVDARNVKRALTGLILNAQEALAGQGKVTVSVAERYEELPEKHNPKSKPGLFAMIEIQDSGVGMSEDTRRRAIEPFFTTKDATTGVGLDLALAYGMMQSFGGWLEITSQPEKGTKARLFFPSDPEASQEQGP